MKTIRTFVNEDNTVTLVCPSCNTPKNISVAAFKNKCHFLKVRCPCDTTFRVHLDFRLNYRKSTQLPGTYVCLKPAGVRGARMTVNDISLRGLAMTVPEKHDLHLGCVLELAFHLDDRKKTLLKKKATVRSVNGNFVGCQFTDIQFYEKEIGFYLKR